MRNAEMINFLETKLNGVVSNIIAPRERRIFAETTTANLIKVMTALKESGMGNLGSITGLDNGDRFEVIYHLYDNDGLIVNIKVFTARETPKVPTVTDVYPGSFLYERELMDLLGIDVEGTPPNRRYPLPDDWPAGQYPLRKDWKGLPSKEEVNSK